MDYATALQIVTWAANEYHYLRATGLKPSRGTPYSMEEVKEAVEFMAAPRVVPLDAAREYHPAELLRSPCADGCCHPSHDHAA